MGINIYKIKNTVNNKVYIGQTKYAIETRFNRHKTNARMKTNRRLYDSMNKYGFDKFVVELLETVSKSNANKRERYWIKKHNALNKEFGYNMAEGGEGGKTSSGKGTMFGKTAYDKWLKEHGQDFADKKRLEVNNKISKSNIGKKTGDDNTSKQLKVRKKISKTLKEKGIIPPRPNWELNGTAHPMQGKHHTIETKSKLKSVRLGKTYEEIVGSKKAKEMKSNKSKRWTENNPNSKDIKLEELIIFITQTPNCKVSDLKKQFNISKPGLHYKLKIIANGITPGKLIKMYMQI